MSDLTDFLIARIAEDEAVAREAGSLAETPWRATYGRQVETPQDGYLVTPEDEHADPGDPSHPVGQHIARHDPVRVLAESEAKRHIVDRYTFASLASSRSERPADAGAVAVLEYALRALSLPYVDHPDYRDEWRHGLE